MITEKLIEHVGVTTMSVNRCAEVFDVTAEEVRRAFDIWLSRQDKKSDERLADELERSRAQAREYRKRNPYQKRKRSKDYHRNYYLLNGERIKAQQRERYRKKRAEAIENGVSSEV